MPGCSALKQPVPCVVLPFLQKSTKETNGAKIGELEED